MDTYITCFRCGVCCTRYQVNLSFGEARNIADKLKIEWDKFINEYTDHRWPGTSTFLLKHKTGACIFLSKTRDGTDETCRIHSFKPSSCIYWTSGIFRKECQEGLVKYWDLTVSVEGELQGQQKQLESFQTFLQSLENPHTDAED